MTALRAEWRYLRERLKNILRTLIAEGPVFAFYYILNWLYTPRMLRYKAASTPYPRVRHLLLRRSGIEMGHHVDLNHGVLILGSTRKPPVLILKDRVDVGPYVTFLTTSYPTHSVLRSHPEMEDQINMFGPIVVEEDVWIGAGAIIFPGVRIGRGAVLGAGSVVKNDVDPWTVVAGTPARRLRTMRPVENRDRHPDDKTRLTEPN